MNSANSNLGVSNAARPAATKAMPPLLTLHLSQQWYACARRILRMAKISVVPLNITFAMVAAKTKHEMIHTPFCAPAKRAALQASVVMSQNRSVNCSDNESPLGNGDSGV